MNSSTSKPAPTSAVDEDVVMPALPVVDPHFHLWNTQGYTYFAPEFLADAKSGHKVEAGVYVECGMAYSDDARVPFRPVGETVHAVKQAELIAGSGHGFALGILGGADLTLGAAVRPVLEAHVEAGKGRFRGIRARVAQDADPAAAYPPDTGYPEDTHLLQNEAFRAGAKCVADMGLVLDVWGLHPQLDDLYDFAAACPDVKILINHCGGPLGVGHYAGRRAEVFKEWAAAIRKAATLPHVHIKLSGLGIARMGFRFEGPGGQARSSDELVAAWKPYIRTCLDAFGAERSIFASNFSVDRQAASYRMLLNAYKKMLQDVSEDERRAIFAGNARRFYNLPKAA